MSRSYIQNNDPELNKESPISNYSDHVQNPRHTGIQFRRLEGLQNLASASTQTAQLKAYQQLANDSQLRNKRLTELSPSTHDGVVQLKMNKQKIDSWPAKARAARLANLTGNAGLNFNANLGLYENEDTAYFSTPKKHSEELIVAAKGGANDAKVSHNIYSEREPCEAICEPMLIARNDTWNVSYTYDRGERVDEIYTFVQEQRDMRRKAKSGGSAASAASAAPAASSASSSEESLSDLEIRRQRYAEYYGADAKMPEDWEPYNEEDSVDYGYRDYLRSLKKKG